MDKCKGCSLVPSIPFYGNGLGKCGIIKMKKCHLTESGKNIIKAMLAGEWKCATCGYITAEAGRLQLCGNYWGNPCSLWQPRKELSESSSD